MSKNGRKNGKKIDKDKKDKKRKKGGWVRGEPWPVVLLVADRYHRQVATGGAARGIAEAGVLPVILVTRPVPWPVVPPGHGRWYRSPSLDIHFPSSLPFCHVDKVR
jgi:hypothetical protein